MAEAPLNDPKRVGKKVLEERFTRKGELADVGLILSSKEGRRFLWRLLTKGFVFRTCFTGNNTTFWNEGRRDLALEFLMDTQRFPELYLTMVKENQPGEESRPEEQ
jgi:hypothetical protein